MKNVLCLIFVSINFFSFSETVMKDYWVVKSDEKDSSVKNNLCLITGNVFEVFSEKGVEGGIISNLSRTNSCRTDENGHFSLTISTIDTAIFFYHESYIEIICWKYDFKGGHHVVMDFVCSEKLADGMIYMEEKPVIYAYSDEKIKADMILSNAGDLTFTYPEYRDGWEIEIDPKNGILKDGVNYPYLFWEGKKRNLSFNSTNGLVEGFFVNTDTIISFFESSLADLGLNSTESTDFITYWGPKLQQHEFATIQFLVDEAYVSQIGDLIVSPEPDAMRRVYLLYEGSNQPKPSINMTHQDLITFDRKGFTIVEWGGTDLTSPLDF